MAYERMLRTTDLCHVAAQVAANGFSPITEALPFDEWLTHHGAMDNARFMQGFSIEEYLCRCIRSGALPARSAPLYGIEPAPLKDFSALFILTRDFQAWIKTSQVQAPESWAQALIESIAWDYRPIPGTQVITGKPKGRPSVLAKDAQAEADKIALSIYNTSGCSMTHVTQKYIGDKLAHAYGAEYNTVKDRFKVKLCKEYIKHQKQ
ncbi:hypothetical protein HAP94_10085 [Acidithiobacillus ferrivorans]|nr:hypothetical protein [Acidithiobacillus ferrivorans]